MKSRSNTNIKMENLDHIFTFLHNKKIGTAGSKQRMKKLGQHQNCLTMFKNRMVCMTKVYLQKVQ